MTTQRELSDTWKDTWHCIQEEAVQVSDWQQYPDGPRYAFRGENQIIEGYSQAKLWRDRSNKPFQYVWEKQVINLREASRFMPERNLEIDEDMSVPNCEGQFSVPSSTKEDIRRLLMDLQHGGADTLLLDITMDLNVALYFACTGNTPPVTGGVLPDGCIKVFKLPQSCLWVPHSNNKRAQAQQGRHVLPCYQHGAEHVSKWIVPGVHKRGILRHLAYLYRVHDATLFPDLDGAITFRRFMNGSNPA